MTKREWKARAQALQGDVEHWTCMAGAARRREETLRRDYALLEEARDRLAEDLVAARREIRELRTPPLRGKPAMDMARLAACLHGRRSIEPDVTLTLSDGSTATMYGNGKDTAAAPSYLAQYSRAWR